MKAKRGRVHGWAGWRAGLGRIVLTTLNKCERERVGGHSKSRRAGRRVCRQSFLSLPGATGSAHPMGCTTELKTGGEA